MKPDAPLDAVLALTPAQVGLLIGVHERTVFTMLARGELPVVLIKNKQRVRRSDLEAWIASLEPLLPGEVLDERVAL